MTRLRAFHLTACSLGAAAISIFVPGATAQLLDPADADAPSLDAMPLVLDARHGGCGKACRAFHLADLGWQPGQMLPGARTLRGPGPTDPTDVLHNNLSVEVSPPTRFITGSNMMTIKSNVAGLTSFTFRLRSNFSITACQVTDSVGTYSATPTTPPADNTSYGRTITFTRPIALNATFTVRIDYNGAPSNLAFGNFYARGQNNSAANPGVICTLSEPYYAGTWWPCKDGDVRLAGDNADKATLSIAITAPEAFSSTANGTLVGITVPSAGKRTFTYATSYPLATYLVCFSTSVYNTWTSTYTYPGGTMPMEFFIYPVSDTPARRTAWEQSAAMMAALRPVYGEYPFVNEKYGVYQFEFGGGMEHQTNSGQGGNSAWNESLTAHELGHQWFGDNVTCRTWHDIWLNEGFATYAEALWAERKPGSTGLAALRSAMNARRPASFSLSVYCTDVTDVNRIFSSDASYDKAAWVVHQLRRIVGDTQFAAILAAYRAAYQNSAATTADFTTLASSVAGQNLDWYFNPWIYGIGAPRYEYGWQNATIDGRGYVRLHVRQTQQGVSASYPLFTMPLDVRMTTAGAPGTTINTIVRNDAATDHFLIPVSAPIASLALDPDDWVLTIAKASIAYTPGPPKVVSLSLAPGATIAAAAAPTALRIGFSDNVTAPPAAFAVSRVGGSSVPFTLGYDATNFATTLTFASPLAPGTYNVAVSDTVAAVSSSALLDGELASNSVAALPSGDGQPGGMTTYTFTIAAPPCPADFNGQDGVTIDDIFAFLNAWFAGLPSANFDGQGGVTIDDIFVFLNAWFAGC